MDSFILSGREVFDGFPEPVFWTKDRRLSYWNPAAERLCRGAGEMPLEHEELPSFLAALPEESCLTEGWIAGRHYTIQVRPMNEGCLYLLRPEAAQGGLSQTRVADLMARMRSPMSSMYAAMQAVSGEEETLEILNRNYCRLLRLMEEVELSQQLDGESFLPSVLDLAGLCRDVMRQVQSLARDYGPVIQYEEACGSILVRGEERLLRQMLYQLLSNAWRAAGQEGSVTIQLSLLGRRAVLHVTNTGKGISEAALGAAFDPERAEGLSGGGLGIPICRRIAQLHGGTLMLESGPSGTTATCSLPVVRENGGVLCTPPLRYQVELGIPEVLVALSDVLPREAYASRDLE